jgi:L-alanine-DL-glutamate epimerase-like enolase superfamily enzyme
MVGTDGAEGWGEAWCNFPGVGAEHRARLLIDTVAPLALGTAWADAPALWRSLDARLHVLAIQTGEPGPLAQCAAALDLAAWDLAARRAGLPLWRALDGSSASTRVYASGLHPDQALELAASRRAIGHRAFKLKVGFTAETDVRACAELRSALGDEATLMLDANQAWTTESAPARIAALASCAPTWIEEPISADHDPAAWAALAAAVAVPLAAGENVRGIGNFDALVGSRALAYVQPDLGKWGGFTGCREVGRRVEMAGASFCPHWLGGPIGLVASMHLRSAIGNSGWVEWDANPNPLHDRLGGQLPAVCDGQVQLATAPGLGLDLRIAHFEDLVTWSGAAG